MARPHLFVLLAVLVSALPAVGADKPTRAEIGDRGKVATAFVDVPGRGSGTAFCVHPSGLFVTNEHVVRGVDKGEVQLVLDAALKTQRVVAATVVRADKDRDLALLRVTAKGDFSALSFATGDEVRELSNVIAFGFPLGRALANGAKDYPSISVNAGNVSSFRRKGGDVDRILVDVSVTFGSSGGPLLDDDGKVVGVVAAGIPGQRGINLAIPVAHVSTFLAAPVVQFAPPAILRAAVATPTEFTAAVVSFVPGAKPPTVTLRLTAEGEAAREFPMAGKDGTFTATAAPVAKVGPPRLDVTVQIGRGTVTGQCGDAVLKAGNTPLRLSGVKRIELTPKAAATTADGKTVDGPVTLLGETEITVGDQAVKLDLSKVTRIDLAPAPGVQSVTATVIATLDGKEVARAETTIPILDPDVRPAAAPGAVAITPPTLDADKVVRMLPGPFTTVCLGGGGRYLIFQIPKLKKLAVFDVNEARVTKYIPLAEDDVTFAAGLDAVVIGLKKAGKLERWSLTTFELEKSAPPPFNEPIQMVLMGHGSSTHVVVNGYFLDLATFRQSAVVNDQKHDRIWGAGDFRYASGDGTVFASWNTHLSPTSSSAFVLEGNVVKRYEGGDLRHVIPGPDGRTVFSAKGIVSQTLQRADPSDDVGYCLPAVRGDFFLALTPASPDLRNRNSGSLFTVYLRGIKRPIAKLDQFDHGMRFDGWDREAFGAWKRVYMVPDAKVIAVLPPSNDQVVLFKFDAEAALEKSGEDYLLVTSRPPRAAKAGATLTYALQVKSKHGGLTYRLDSGPAGMTVSAEGVVTWAVPADATAAAVILTVRDAKGQEVFHTFPLAVTK